LTGGAWVNRSSSIGSLPRIWKLNKSGYYFVFPLREFLRARFNIRAGEMTLTFRICDKKEMG
jgi:hypothetical protein